MAGQWTSMQSPQRVFPHQQVDQAHNLGGSVQNQTMGTPCLKITNGVKVETAGRDTSSGSLKHRTLSDSLREPYTWRTSPAGSRFIIRKEKQEERRQGTTLHPDFYYLMELWVGTQ